MSDLETEVERLGRMLMQLTQREGLLEGRLKTVEENLFDPYEDGTTIHDRIDGIDGRVQDLEYPGLDDELDGVNDSDVDDIEPEVDPFNSPNDPL